MSLKYGVLSLMVFCVVLLLALKNYEIWTHPIGLLPEKELVKKSEKKTEIPSMIEGQKDPTAIKSYISIAEKNIFNPERKDFPIITPPMAEQPKKSMGRPKIILYGVTFAEDYQYALIANPGRPLQKGERESMTFKVGDRIGEYQLAKILPDRITLEAEGDTFEVLLYDPKMPKRRIDVKTEGKPATITSTLPVPAPTSVGPPPAIPPKEPVERPREPVQERIATPPPVPRPVTPPFPPPVRSRGIPSYPVPVPVPQMPTTPEMGREIEGRGP